MAGARESTGSSVRDDDPSEKRGCFRLRKWYFDFLTGGLDYCFVYFADVRILGATFRSLTVHVARQGRGVPATRSLGVDLAAEQFDGRRGRTISFSGGDINIHDNWSAINADEPGCSVHLRYAPLNGFHPRPVVIGGGGRSQILWRPICLKSKVSGSVRVGGDVIEVEGCNGYVDYLESSYLPPAVPVRTLHWGRLHHPDLDLVFMRAADGPGTAAWSRLSCQAGTSVIHCDDVAIVNVPDPHGSVSHASSPSGYTVHAACDSRRVEMKVRHASVVQENSFIDRREVKSAGVRYVIKKLTRNPRSTKWLSYADVVVEEGRRTRHIHDVPLIDEFALL